MYSRSRVLSGEIYIINLCVISTKLIIVIGQSGCEIQHGYFYRLGIISKEASNSTTAYNTVTFYWHKIL